MLRRYLLSPYYLIDKNLKIFDAMKASAKDSVPFSSAIFGLIGVFILLVLAAAVIQALFGAAGVIAVIAYYAYYCAPAVRYQEIKLASKKL